ncbi:MAG: hypothetical protein KC912_15585 [Proteobacteria bacterium]|nr:hypothetical protein [Pseudomonadota bacterium]
MSKAAEILFPDASEAIVAGTAALSVPTSVNESAAIEWAELLGKRNGFTMYDGALLFLPSQPNADVPSVREVNAIGSWKRFYDLPPFFVIALDALGQPIGIREDGIAKLNAITGELEPLTLSLGAFALRVQAGKIDIGQSVASRWAESFGPLALTHRLVPKHPPHLGGTFAVSNLRKWPTKDVLETYGALAKQLRRLSPDSEASLAWPPGRP